MLLRRQSHSLSVMSKETKPTKIGPSVDFGEEEVENDLLIWTPKEFQIQRVWVNIVDSDRVSICAVPKGANIFTGENILDNALVISSHHLQFLRFPFHPLFQIIWRVLRLHPMQLNPNSYMLLSGLLVMGKGWEASLGLGDFFYFHRSAHIAEMTLYLNFASRPLRKVFDERASNFSNWKTEPLMVLRDWSAPEVPALIPKAFSEHAVTFESINGRQGVICTEMERNGEMKFSQF
ncbi:uncharacterized protein LOC133737550 isoform X2 [Rosa rugosa]|uniref:uncharacterized protein LOC133737550 isoform X2 n=1 Tax=Rosa rugosa TaxID=74645 RepID=UPI002B40B6AB|nr:uncharacterized protein LOC133737550 isoform X2 [Rosa rugosa]